MDADETVNAMRYEAAEKLLEAGQPDTAAAAFDAISTYRDAVDRANQIRYDAADGLSTTDPEAAARAFDQLGDFSNAASRAAGLRYGIADATAKAGDWQGAAEMFEALGSYADSADRALQVRYEAAAQMVLRQEWDEAVVLYTALGDYADCKERITATRYAQAEAAEAAGEALAAARLYQALGSYRDAAERAEKMYAQYFSGPMAAVEKASQAKNYQEVLQIMSWLDVSDLPSQYASLTTMHQEALYQEAERLLGEGKPYEAYAYYQQLPEGYRNVSSRMQRACYLLLGTWEDKQGNRYIFRGEGVCNLNGEALYFNIQGYDVYTGQTKDGLTLTHRLGSVTRDSAWLADVRDKQGVSIQLQRVKE
ncbi:MAG: hypothetical protein PUC00_06750, partial [Clostridiales bacterium]|nr:hypothetical protein [Clostridiales bacterium]